ncbi:MAG: HEAT repeat domain-containing protein [Bacilli bacterium]|nr:HEAT repeat domain-containing protein [Bacilli bacterium]MBQ8218736.1 HEAT repeat domain-containing protein [Bacilli bacterium]
MKLLLQLYENGEIGYKGFEEDQNVVEEQGIFQSREDFLEKCNIRLKQNEFGYNYKLDIQILKCDFDDALDQEYGLHKMYSIAEDRSTKYLEDVLHAIYKSGDIDFLNQISETTSLTMTKNTLSNLGIGLDKFVDDPEVAKIYIIRGAMKNNRQDILEKLYYTGKYNLTLVREGYNIDIFSTNPDPYCRIAMIKQAVINNRPDLIRRLINDPDNKVRLEVIVGAVELKLDDVILKMKDDSNFNVRRYIALYGYFADQYITDEDDQVRTHAAKHLLNKPNLGKLMFNLLNDSCDEVVEYAWMYGRKYKDYNILKSILHNHEKFFLTYAEIAEACMEAEYSDLIYDLYKVTSDPELEKQLKSWLKKRGVV